MFSLSIVDTLFFLSTLLRSIRLSKFFLFESEESYLHMRIIIFSVLIHVYNEVKSNRQENRSISWECLFSRGLKLNLFLYTYLHLYFDFTRK